MTEKLHAGEKPSSWRWLWIGWLALFVVIEGAAVWTKKAGRTLSANMWRWFPTWGWWLLPAGLLLSLVGHFSPLHTTVIPVILFGAAMVARIAGVEWSRGERDTQACQVCGTRYRGVLDALNHGVGFCKPTQGDGA